MPTETKSQEVSGRATDANHALDMSAPGCDYEKSKVDATLAWEKATRDVWNCVEKARPGDAGGNGR